MTDRLGASLSKLSPSVHKLLSNPMELLQGTNLSEVPVSFWHFDVLGDLEEELIPPALAPLFFLSIFLCPIFMGSCGFLSRRHSSWRECSALHWLETTAVRRAKKSLGNLPWSRASKEILWHMGLQMRFPLLWEPVHCLCICCCGPERCGSL